MLDGVVVLAQRETLTTTGFLIMIGIAALMAVFFSIFVLKYSFKYDWGVSSTGLITAGGFVVILVLVYWLFPLPQHTIYKVAIEDKSISMVDFYNYYDIISTEGSIYTVTLKENK